MKKNLTFEDRAALIYQILPKYGQLETMKTVRSIKSKINLTRAEMEAVGAQERNNTLIWKDSRQVKPIDVEISEKELETILNGVNNLDRMGQIQEGLLDTIEKFM